MQSSFMGSLMELAEKDGRVLYLTADSGEGGLDLMFRRNFPERSFNFGIAEQNLVAAAAGLAATGKIPFVYTAAPFLVYRAFEFIRDDVCLNNLPVKLVGSGSGLSVSSLGPTHHTTEDLAVLRSLPNLTILSPATPHQAYACIQEAYRIQGPVYIRLGMNREKEFYPEDCVLPEGSGETVRKGSDVALFTTGSILEAVMEAAELLERTGISVSVINISRLKPFDASIVQEAENAGLFCVAEEHNIYGGLASVIADAMVDAGIRKRLIRIGLNDCFSVGYGPLPRLREENGLDAASIAERVRAGF